MLFAYKAQSKTGEVYTGLLESIDRFTLAKELRSRGSTPISIKEKGAHSLDFAALLKSALGHISKAELILFCKNLSGMLRAGLSLARAIAVLEKQTKNAALQKILKSLANDINTGEPFSTALAKFPKVYSALFVSMVRAGEESGNLAGALTDIGGNLEKAHSLNKKIHGALVYPGVILSAMVIIGVLMFAFVVPTLASTFKELGVTLPKSTQAIIWMGNFFSEHLVITFLIIILGSLGMVALLRAPFLRKYIDFLTVHLPVIGNLAKELNTARTTRTMSSLLLAGVPITRAIEITEDVVQNIYYKKVLREAKTAVEKGSSFSKTFEENTHLYPIMMSEMIEVGEETGKLSDMLLQVAAFYEEEIENRTKNLSTIIEPLLMIVIGAAVGFFAISMISPLYSVLNQIQ
ncbi:MAG: type II secretion system F family protein [Patescibacteria group bacterium]